MEQSYNSAEAALLGSFASHHDVYTAYGIAAQNKLLGHLEMSWSEQEEFEEFLVLHFAPIPYLGIIFVNEDDAASVAFRLAAQQISVRQLALRNEKQYPVIFIAPQSQVVGFRNYWEALMKDVVTKLRPLTQGKLVVNENDDADTRLRAIENIQYLTSPNHPIPHTCFVAGLDKAYDRNIGYALTYEYDMKEQTPEGQAELAARYRLTHEDVAQREKVARLTKALVRLFGERDFGKLVFCVGPDFSNAEHLANGTPYQTFMYLEPSKIPTLYGHSM